MGICSFRKDLALTYTPPTASVNAPTVTATPVRVTIPSIKLKQEHYSGTYTSLSATPQDYNITVTFTNPYIPIPSLLPVNVPQYSFYQGSISQPDIPPLQNVMDFNGFFNYDVVDFSQYPIAIYLFPTGVIFPSYNSNININVPDIYIDIPEYKDMDLIQVDVSDFMHVINRFMPSVSKMLPQVKGSYMQNVNYTNETLYMHKIAEWSFHKKTITDYITLINSLFSVDALLLSIDTYLAMENTKASVHLNKKERALLWSNAISSVYSKIFAYKVNKFKALVDKQAFELKQKMSYNNEIMELWSRHMTLLRQHHKTYTTYLNSFTSKVENYIRINNELRECFYYMGKILTGVVALRALNIERDRLLIELANANMNVNISKEREKAVVEKANTIRERNAMLTEMLQAVSYEYQALLAKINSYVKRLDALNATLDALRISTQSSVDRVNAEGTLRVTRNSVAVLEEFISSYSRLVNEWYSLSANSLNTYYSTLHSKSNIDAWQQIISNELSSLSNLAANYILPVYHTILACINTEEESARLMAQANVQSTIIESYS